MKEIIDAVKALLEGSGLPPYNPYSVELVSRRDAGRRGDNTYFTGVMCRNGHRAPRYVGGGACSECLKKRRRETARE